MLGCLHDRKKFFTKLAKEIIERYKKNKTNTSSQSKTMKNPPKSLKKLKENPLNSSLINLPLEKIIENVENPTPRTSTVVQPLALSLSSVSTIETSKTPKNKNIQIPSIHKNTSEPNIQFENQENNRMSTSDIFPPQSKSTPRVKIPLHLPKVTAFKTDDTIKRDSLSYNDAQSQSKLLNNVTNQNSSLKNGIRRALMPIKPSDENNRRSSIPILRPFSPWTTFNWSEKKNVGLDEFKMKPIDEKTLTDCLPTGKIRSGPRRSTPFTLALDENHDVRPSINEKDPIKKVKTFRINKKVKSKEIKTKVKSDKSRMPKVGKKEENVESIDSIKERSTADNEEERMVF